MFDLIKGVLSLSGEQKKKIIVSYFFTFIDGILANVQVFAIAYAISLIIQDKLQDNTWLIILMILVASLLIRTTVKYIINYCEQGMGIFTFAQQRVITGDRVKKFNMGFFSDNNVGNLTAIFANDLSFIEQYGMGAMGILTASVLSIIVSILILIFVNPVVAIIYSVIVVVAYFILKSYYTVTVLEGKKQREVTKDTAEAIIEYVSGMSVIKAFNLEGKRFAKTENTFRNLKMCIWVLKK